MKNLQQIISLLSAFTIDLISTPRWKLCGSIKEKNSIYDVEYSKRQLDPSICKNSDINELYANQYSVACKIFSVCVVSRYLNRNNKFKRLVHVHTCALQTETFPELDNDDILEELKDYFKTLKELKTPKKHRIDFQDDMDDVGDKVLLLFDHNKFYDEFDVLYDLIEEVIKNQNKCDNVKKKIKKFTDIVTMIEDKFGLIIAKMLTKFLQYKNTLSEDIYNKVNAYKDTQHKFIGMITKKECLEKNMEKIVEYSVSSINRIKHCASNVLDSLDTKMYKNVQIIVNLTSKVNRNIELILKKIINVQLTCCDVLDEFLDNFMEMVQHIYYIHLTSSLTRALERDFDKSKCAKRINRHEKKNRNELHNELNTCMGK